MCGNVVLKIVCRKPRVGKASEDAVKPSGGADPPRFRGGSDLSPGGRLSTTPARGVGHRRKFSPGTLRAVAWGGRGTVVG